MVASIITEHPRIESRFITSPSGRRGYPNYRPGFSHIKKIALLKTSHLNKGWIRKSFAFFPFLSFLKGFLYIFFPLVFCFMLGCSGLLQWFYSPTLRWETTLTCGFLGRQWWMKHLLGARCLSVCVCLCVYACVCAHVCVSECSCGMVTFALLYQQILDSYTLCGQNTLHDTYLSDKCIGVVQSIWWTI